MIAFDSSVIIAALLSWHEQHAVAARALEDALGAKRGVVVPQHALFESYAVMTRLPPPHRLAPLSALSLLKDNFGHLQRSRSAWPILERLASEGLGGGITYDAVILDAAVEAGATELLTLNERDYERLSPKIRIMGV